MRLRRALRARRDRVDDEIRAWRDATSDTTTWALWSHAVVLAAIRKGADPEVIRKTERIRSAMSRAFKYGEPVWMAADEVAFLAKELKKGPPRSAREELRSAVAVYTRPGRDARRRR